MRRRGRGSHEDTVTQKVFYTLRVGMMGGNDDEKASCDRCAASDNRDCARPALPCGAGRVFELPADGPALWPNPAKFPARSSSMRKGAVQPIPAFMTTSWPCGDAAIRAQGVLRRRELRARPRPGIRTSIRLSAKPNAPAVRDAEMTSSTIEKTATLPVQRRTFRRSVLGFRRAFQQYAAVCGRSSDRSCQRLCEHNSLDRRIAFRPSGLPDGPFSTPLLCNPKSLRTPPNHRPEPQNHVLHSRTAMLLSNCWRGRRDHLWRRRVLRVVR
jgi:hypothetical protein